MKKIGIIIPCYNVVSQIDLVVEGLDFNKYMVYVIDDKCPQKTGEYVNKKYNHNNLTVIKNKENVGVGGATIEGFKAAINDSCDVIVKVDGDNQMDLTLLDKFIEPIINSQADYTKGNRFYNLERIEEMPKIRIFGNAILSFMTKLSSGYWNIFDPTNGYIAISGKLAKHLPYDQISKRYFFESDMLFHLNMLNAKILDVPMHARYNDEKSSLIIRNIVGYFFIKNVKNTFARIFFRYFLWDFNIASLELLLGSILVTIGFFYGTMHWVESFISGKNAPLGVIMAASLSIILGFQMFISFLSYDFQSVPKDCVANRLPDQE